MPSTSRRRLELLLLSRPLQRYARTLQPDTNASLMLVHKVMASALAEPVDQRLSRDLEGSLRADLRALARDAAPGAHA